MHTWSAALIAVTAAFVSHVAFSQEAVGNLSVKGDSIRLTHAYAFWKDQQPFRSGLDLYVLLSDSPIADKDLPSDDDRISKLAERVRSNKLHAIELHFADAGKTLNEAEQGAVYDNRIAPARHGLGGILEYKPTASDGTALNGSVSTRPGAQELVGFEVVSTFKVRVPPTK